MISHQLVTIREAVWYSKEDRIPVTEYTLRSWVKAGIIPTRQIGKKHLLYYPTLVQYIRCGNDPIGAPVPETTTHGIRPIEI